ncbi:hypothetical protein V6N12_017477 [Hibiscus sabdariffa]|uniref:RNase H type-1 domain-containing protein n=1 Tax=Hibiscus sabdariffa TaxID=183260 RepID=A0ABR2CFX8_9ROSI
MMSILSHGKRLQHECRAIVVVVRQPGVEPVLPRDQIRWERSPVGLVSDQGRWIIGFLKGIGVCSVLDVELWGIYEGLLTAWSVGTRNLVVEVDSLEVIRVVQQSLAGFSSLSLVVYIVKLLQRLWSVKLQHVLREGNRLVDGMTKFATIDYFMCYRFLSPSNNVLQLIQLYCPD